VGTNAMLKAAPDGYTLLASTLNTAVMQALGVATAQHSHLAPGCTDHGRGRAAWLRIPVLVRRLGATRHFA